MDIHTNNDPAHTMDNKKQNRPDGKDIAADIIEGATAALAYSNEEIIATLPPGEAQEFIDLRNSVKARLREQEMRCYGEAPEQHTPMAAEDDTPYKN